MNMHRDIHNEWTESRKDSFWYWFGLLGYWIRVVWYWMKMAWYWICLLWIYSVRAFFAFVLAILLWDFTELLGIPLIQDLKTELRKGLQASVRSFIKEDPAQIQARCRHLTQRNGRWNHFPACRQAGAPESAFAKALSPFASADSIRTETYVAPLRKFRAH